MSDVFVRRWAQVGAFFTADYYDCLGEDFITAEARRTRRGTWWEDSDPTAGGGYATRVLLAFGDVVF